MPGILFTHPLGINKPQLKSYISSASALDHAVSAAQSDAQHRGFKADPASTAEITALYNAAIKDGRYVSDFPRKPEDVAAKLGMQLSPKAADEIKKAGTLHGATPPALGRGGTVAGSVTVVCVAVVVVLCAEPGPNANVIIDRSGMLKF